MEEMNNLNQQPPVPPSTPPIPAAPSIPAAHQMMGAMPVAPAVASSSGMMANITAVLILIVGGGSLYFALTKESSPQSDTSVNQMDGFTSNNENNTNPVNGTRVDNESTASTVNEETTQPVAVATSSANRIMFKCEDLFPATDMQKFTKDSKPVTVIKEESSSDIKCEYQQRVNDDPNDLTHAYNVDIQLPYLSVTTAMLFGSAKSNTSSLEDIPNIGTEAFTGVLGGILRPVIVLSTNQKYVFWVSSTWDMGAQKTDKTYLNDIAKIVDENLSKY